MNGIGVLGGGFDPIHNGHIALGQAAKKFLNCTKVLMMPAGNPPHRQTAAPANHRMNMVKLACQNSGLTPDGYDITHQACYTVDTLQTLRQAHPRTPLWLIIGSDNLRQIAGWRDVTGIAALAGLAVALRPGFTDEVRTAAALYDNHGLRTVFIPFVGPEISSTAVRQACMAGGDISAFCSPAVRDYITEYGLYRPVENTTT